jgi:hypothetical protein
MAPLAERFVYLNLRYLVADFYRLDHHLKRRLENLRELNLGRCNVGYSDVVPLNIVSTGSFTWLDLPALMTTHFVGDHVMQGALSGVQTSMYSVVARARYAASMVFYTNGSLIGLRKVVLAIRYRVRLVFLLRSLLLCLWHCDILGRVLNPQKKLDLT